MPADTLSREQIERMEAGPEMDALVAERVMGCKVERRDYREGFRCACDEGDDLDHPHSAHRVHFDSCHSYSGLNCDHDTLAAYSTDIAAAWTVVEQLVGGKREQSWSCIKRHGWDDTEPEYAWRASFYWTGDTYEATAPTAPLAICRVALLATLPE